MAKLPDSNPFPSVGLTNSYSCNSTMAYIMTVENGANDTYNVTLNLAQFQLQAFEFKPPSGTGFGKGMPGQNG